MNHKLCETEHEKMTNAWHKYIDTGVIPNGILRPDIYASWVRCRKERVYDPFEKTLTAEEIAQKQIENSSLIANAKGIIEDIDSVLAKILGSGYSIMLLDPEGDIIDLKNRGSDLITLGHHCSEANSGSNAISIAIKEKKVAEVYGYEHLYPDAVDWHTIAVPIFDLDKSMVGIIGVLNQTDRVSSIVPLVKIGGQVCESGFKLEQLAKYKMGAFFDNGTEPVIITNNQGTIINTNQLFLDLVNIPLEQLLGQKINDYISTTADDNLFSPFDANNVFANVSVKGRNRTLYSIKMKKSIINNLDNLPLMLFFFETEKTQNLKTGRPDNSIDQRLYSFDNLIGESAILNASKTIAQKAAKLASNVLIEGESGTGKEIIAQSIHGASSTKGPFVVINCGALTKELLQSELFGYEEGAFTGAKKGGKPGKFEIADGGTLFLDEIGEMPLDMQVSLLRFLQEKNVTRIGGERSKKVNVRIIAATNRDLYKEVQNGNFREDLYYRLNVIDIKMPSLRQRMEDIPILSKSILNSLCQKLSITEDIQISEEVIERLCRYDWPGNVRELQNVIERALVCIDSSTITLDCLPARLKQIDEVTVIQGGDGSLEDYEKLLIIQTIMKNQGNISESAKKLGIARSTLYQKIEKYKIDLDDIVYGKHLRLASYS